MQRTQISLTAQDRKLLDVEQARTGRSISALIRYAVERTYGEPNDGQADLAAMDQAFGAWGGREETVEGQDYVDDLRHGQRLQWTASQDVG